MRFKIYWTLKSLTFGKYLANEYVTHMIMKFVLNPISLCSFSTFLEFENH